MDEKKARAPYFSPLAIFTQRCGKAAFPFLARILSGPIRRGPTRTSKYGKHMKKSWRCFWRIVGDARNALSARDSLTSVCSPFLPPFSSATHPSLHQFSTRQELNLGQPQTTPIWHTTRLVWGWHDWQRALQPTYAPLTASPSISPNNQQIVYLSPPLLFPTIHALPRLHTSRRERENTTKAYHQQNNNQTFTFNLFQLCNPLLFLPSQLNQKHFARAIDPPYVYMQQATSFICSIIYIYLDLYIYIKILKKKKKRWCRNYCRWKSKQKLSNIPPVKLYAFVLKS